MVRALGALYGPLGVLSSALLLLLSSSSASTTLLSHLSTVITLFIKDFGEGLKPKCQILFKSFTCALEHVVPEFYGARGLGVSERKVGGTKEVPPSPPRRRMTNRL